MAFVGAGLSRPTCVHWRGLIAAIRELLPEADRPPPSDDFEAISRLVAKLARELVPNELDALIRQLFLLNVPPPHPYPPLSKCDFRHFVTTNYDPFLSISLSPERLSKVRLHKYPELFAANLSLSRTCVYLHGAVTEPGQPQPLVLDEHDYQQAYEDPGWARDFLTQIVQQFSICFIGTSIEDPIAQCMKRMERMRANARKSYPQALEWFRVVRCPTLASVPAEVQAQMDQGFRAICYIGEDDDHTQLYGLLSHLADQTGLPLAPPDGYLATQKPIGGPYVPQG